MTSPYYADDYITLYHGDWRELSDSITGDAIITDPPYGETPLPWDRWPTAWPELAHPIAPAMWCFGSLRMFMQNAHDFRHWKFSHEIIWQKTTSTAIAADKFRRVHELAALWYHGPWNAIQHNVPKIEVGSPRLGRTYRKLTKTRSQTMSDIDLGEWHDDGTRYQTTIIEARNGHRRPLRRPQRHHATHHRTRQPHQGAEMTMLRFTRTVGDETQSAYMPVQSDGTKPVLFVDIEFIDTLMAEGGWTRNA